jgi:hypothetical protein
MVQNISISNFNKIANSILNNKNYNNVLDFLLTLDKRNDESISIIRNKFNKSSSMYRLSAILIDLIEDKKISMNDLEELLKNNNIEISVDTNTVFQIVGNGNVINGKIST